MVEPWLDCSASDVDAAPFLLMARSSRQRTNRNRSQSSTSADDSAAQRHQQTDQTAARANRTDSGACDGMRRWLLLLTLATLVVVSIIFYWGEDIFQLSRSVHADHAHTDAELLSFISPEHDAARQSKAHRIVAVGDLHGDFDQALKTFMMAGLVDKDGLWAAGDTILVQTGDVVDRGPDTIDLYRYMESLRSQAKNAGGEVISLLGNHEVMNLYGDWNYVAPEDIASFGGKEERLKAFAKDGWIGKYLRQLQVAAYVDGTVFFHGGAQTKYAQMGIDGMNEIAKKAVNLDDRYAMYSEKLFGGDGPLWYRGYAQDDEKVVCKKLYDALDAMKAKRMVVGHTPQASGRVLPRCDGHVFMIDVGISRVYWGHSAALEIVGDQVSALYPNGRRDILAK